MAKRIFDVIVAAAGLALTAPILLLVAVAVRLTSPGPVLYKATRVGLHGRPFRMLKFRTMSENADQLGGSSTPADDPRLTSVGRWLRRWKLDEMPQLLNVLGGTMSLVGPRPQVAWAVDRYQDDEKLILTVRPGITDPASLRFANEAEILRGQPDPDSAYMELIHPEKMRLSLDYVRNRSFLGDLKILTTTFCAMLGWRAPHTGLTTSHTAR